MHIAVKRIGGFVFLLLVGLAILAGLIWKEGPQNVVMTLLAFGFAPFAAYVVTSMINFALYVYRWRVIVNEGLPRKQRLGFLRLYLHRMSGYAFMYILPLSIFGSEPIRVGLLAEDGVPVKHATSSVVIDLAFETTAFIFFIAIGFILAIVSGVALGNAGVIVGAGLLIFMAVVGTFYYATVSGKGFFQIIFRSLRLNRVKRFHHVEEWLKGMEAQMTTFLRDRPLMILWLLILSMVMISFRTFENWFIAHFLGVSLNFTQALLSSTIPGFALLIPVPGGLGFLEASNTGLFALLGVTINALALVLIIRLRDAVFMAIGLAHASGQIGRFFKEWLRKSTTPIDKKAVS